ncbi:Mediator of RNA polymerase II transcription subunit 6 [Abeliophyllum distichum]|uniref:Mediator of RNA polymerase II transcription subunit 6 n=1 Tax=Abeliophyllum distichum TaxID=126358 RepID=A0ABD1VPI2_9LAMI
MTGIEYMLSEVTEPHLFVIRKQKRESDAYANLYYGSSFTSIFCYAVDVENENTATESKVNKETIDFKELKRLDHILASMQRKLPPAPPPPPFPEGYTPPTAEGEKSFDNQQAEAQPPVDPIIDQGPSKRRKF